jgi:hypothetical protein
MQLERSAKPGWLLDAPRASGRQVARALGDSMHRGMLRLNITSSAHG